MRDLVKMKTSVLQEEGLICFGGGLALFGS